MTGCLGDGGEADSSVDSSEVSTAGDNRDPARARGDRAAAVSTVWSRRITLHLSDPDNAAWASVDDGDSGDEVWLDRSFDGGVTWNGHVGKTKIPSGGRSWRTMMYSVDDVARHGVGAMRACGKAGNRAEVTCTPWYRSTVNADNRLDAAATALMQLYDPRTAKWRSVGWWNSANALTALLDYSQGTGSTTYRYAIADAFDKNGRDNFTNDYMDDTAWWGLAWVRAYDVTGDPRYLAMARRDADYLWSFTDAKCGGGVWWREDKTYKNAVTNELFIKLAASVHNRTPGDTTYRSRALDVWHWFKASGMINADHLINDGLDASCKNNGQTTWTYNQGVILGGLAELARATGDASLLTEARTLADASTTNAGLNPNGILRESCEAGPDGCGVDGPSFKGAFVRNLGELDRALADHPYRTYLHRQADKLYAADRNTLDQYGEHWAGPFQGVDASRQHAALDLLTAARN
jgi:predicted alpha-1,6-mannanase (GH76 family)